MWVEMNVYVCIMVLWLTFLPPPLPLTHTHSHRTSLLPLQAMIKLWHAKGCPACFMLLDVGCNEGNLTVALYLQARVELPAHVRVCVFGIDVDSELIFAAQKRAQAMQPQLDVNSVAAGVSVGQGSWDILEFRTADICDPHVSNDKDGKTLLSLLLGTTGADLALQHGGLSLVTLFSVTMWIHLNGGDEALSRSIDRCTALLQASLATSTSTSTSTTIGSGSVGGTRPLVPGGSLLIEPQPWRAYKNALKRTKRLDLPLAPLGQLKLRNPDMDLLYLVQKTEKFDSMWDCGREGWGRSLRLFHGGTVEVCPMLQCSEYQALSAPEPAPAREEAEEEGGRGRGQLSGRALKKQRRERNQVLKL